MCLALTESYQINNQQQMGPTWAASLMTRLLEQLATVTSALLSNTSTTVVLASHYSQGCVSSTNCSRPTRSSYSSNVRKNS